MTRKPQEQIVLRIRKRKEGDGRANKNGNQMINK